MQVYVTPIKNEAITTQLVVVGEQNRWLCIAATPLSNNDFLIKLDWKFDSSAGEDKLKKAFWSLSIRYLRLVSSEPEMVSGFVNLATSRSTQDVG